MKLTTFKFYQNTPINNFIDTIHFESNPVRDQYFKTHYDDQGKTKQFDFKFNYLRDRLTLTVSEETFPYNTMNEYNYGSFYSDFEDRMYYFYILNYRHLGATNEISFHIDTVMTFTQGDVLNGLSNIIVERQHLTRKDYNKYLPVLRNNDDVLKTYTKEYIHQDILKYDDFYIIFTSGVDLTKEFGTLEKPQINSSSGMVYDGISSPLDLYVIEQDYFGALMSSLSEFPWVTQTFNKIIQVPYDFIDPAQLKDVAIKNVTYANLKRFESKQYSQKTSLGKLNKSKRELMLMFGLSPTQEEHLFRNEYTTTELYTWDGQALLIDNGFVTDLEFEMQSVLGYENEVAIYPKNYKARGDLTIDNLDGGTFLNDSIILNAFNNIPIMVNNATLSLANNANKRNLAQGNTFTGRVSNVLDNQASTESRIFDLINITSEVSPTQLLSRVTNDYEFYKDRMASDKDLAMTLPTITNQTNSYSMQIANDFFGVTIKHAFPSEGEFKNIRKYYQLFGFKNDFYADGISNINSNSFCNYLQFKGSWRLHNVPVNFMEELRVVFENGVRLWHYDTTKNPMLNIKKDNWIKF